MYSKLIMSRIKQKIDKPVDWVSLRKNNIGRVSANVSSILRQLILAGIGIVWMFKLIDKNGLIQIDAHLLVALGAFVLAVIVELLHYLAELLLNAYYLTDKMKNTEMPTYVSSVSWILWICKLFLVLFAYVMIGVFLCSKINMQCFI